MKAAFLISSKSPLAKRKIRLMIIAFIFSACGIQIPKVLGADINIKNLNPSLIPIHFKLTKAGYVTLVIEDVSGFRVRNLISETWFQAGDNTVLWDGKNDLGRDADAAQHGIYSVPLSLVAPGRYRVRGIVRNAITTHYEFSFYSPGNPSWSTDDHTGGWLANHTPPQAAAYLPPELSPNHEPLVLLGCYVTEGPDGFAWVDLNGKKLGGKKSIGGAWTSAPYIAVDHGSNLANGTSAYVAAVWETAKLSGQYELRINSLSPDKENFKINQIGKFAIGAFERNDLTNILSGFAVYNQVAVISLIKSNQLIVIDANTKQILKKISLPQPRGLMIDSTGRVLLFSGAKLVSFNSVGDLEKQAKPQVIVAKRISGQH